MLEIDNWENNDTAGLLLRGILDVSTVDIFKDKLEVVDNVKEVKIDIDKLRFIDSTGIGGLANGVKLLQHKGISVEIINISAEIFEILDVLGVPEVLGADIFKVK